MSLTCCQSLSSVIIGTQCSYKHKPYLAAVLAVFSLLDHSQRLESKESNPSDEKYKQCCKIRVSQAWCTEVFRRTKAFGSFHTQGN